MNEGKISVRYAQSLFALAEENNFQKEIYTSMERLTQAFFEVPALARTLANPMHSPAEKLELLITASACDPKSLLAHFFDFVIKKGREEFMVFISMSYQKIYREKERVVLGKITSAQPLTEDSIAKIRQLVDKQFSASIELTTQVEPEILGGFVLEVDNYRMDSSIRTELEHIRTELLRD
ncbi:MAG TPA: F0F1 ATP synthase subunit delta [Bacteroidales bacterium]|nr:F0F1 ATP synthase subunit delta [Bacteroidales bacterium]